MRQKLQAAIDKLEELGAFLLGWLAQPSSKIGLTVVVSTLVGSKYTPQWVDATVTIIGVIAGAVLIVYPQKPKA
jgi:hypothetical protein